MKRFTEQNDGEHYLLIQKILRPKMSQILLELLMSILFQYVQPVQPNIAYA